MSGMETKVSNEAGLSECDSPTKANNDEERSYTG